MPTYMYMVCFHCFGYIDLGPITVMFHNAAIIISIYSFLTIGPHLTQLWCNIGLRIHIYTQTNTSIAITSRCEINKCDMCDKWSWKIYKNRLVNAEHQVRSFARNMWLYEDGSMKLMSQCLNCSANQPEQKEKMWRREMGWEVHTVRNVSQNILRHQEIFPLPRPRTRQKRPLLQMMENPLLMPRLGIELIILTRNHMISPDIYIHMSEMGWKGFIQRCSNNSGQHLFNW